jgi:hypothetical protein
MQSCLKILKRFLLQCWQYRDYITSDIVCDKCGAKASDRHSSPRYFKGLNWPPNAYLRAVLFILCHCVTVRVNYNMNQWLCLSTLQRRCNFIGLPGCLYVELPKRGTGVTIISCMVHSYQITVNNLEVSREMAQINLSWCSKITPSLHSHQHNNTVPTLILPTPLAVLRNRPKQLNITTYNLLQRPAAD